MSSINTISRTTSGIRLLCFDERPCFLIDDVGGILPMSPGKAKRYHYEYQKNGSCCVFLAFEPHTGFRYVEVRERRTASDYAQFMQTLLTQPLSRGAVHPARAG